MNSEYLKDKEVLNLETRKFFNNLFNGSLENIKDTKVIVIPKEHILALVKYLQYKFILFDGLSSQHLREIVTNLIRGEFNLVIEYSSESLNYTVNEVISLLNKPKLSDRKSSHLKERIKEAATAISRNSSSWFNGILDQIITNFNNATLSQHPDNSSKNTSNLSRREFLKVAGLATGVAFTNPKELLKPLDLQKKDLVPTKESTSFQEADLNEKSVSTALLSKNNPVVSIPALESDSSLGSDPKLEKSKESIYFIINKNLSVSPRPFNQNDLLHNVPKQISGGHFKSLIGTFNDFSPKKIHPLGPYGELFIKIAQEYSVQIDLDYIALLSIVVSKSLNESHWNSKSDIVKDLKQGLRGMGLFQQETNQVGILGFPNPAELETAEMQIRYEFDKIAKAAKVVKASGKTFKFEDVEIYYLGDSKDKPSSEYYLAYQFAKENALVLMRNMAAYKFEDLLNLFNIWQNGWEGINETKYGLWPKKGNRGDVGQSLKNFNLIFGPFVDSKKVVKREISIDGKVLKKTEIINFKTRTLAIYLKIKFGGAKLPEKIPKNELLGFSSEEIYFALLYLGYNVINYNNFKSNIAKKLISSVDNFDISLLLQPGELNKSLEGLDIKKPFSM